MEGPLERNRGPERESITVFFSYSSVDRPRVDDLAKLSRFFGEHPFVDHQTIRPGAHWEPALFRGLEKADKLYVFWTRHAKRSEWVRKEYEFFDKTHPDRKIVPILADDTPLSDLLSKLQAKRLSELLPEGERDEGEPDDTAGFLARLFELFRNLKDEGAGREEIRRAVTERVKALCGKLPMESEQLYYAISPLRLASPLASLGSRLRALGSWVKEALLHLTRPQIAGLATAVFLSGAAGDYLGGLGGDFEPPDVTELTEQLVRLNTTVQVESEDLVDALRELDFEAPVTVNPWGPELAQMLDSLQQCVCLPPPEAPWPAATQPAATQPAAPSSPPPPEPISRLEVIDFEEFEKGAFSGLAEVLEVNAFPLESGDPRQLRRQSSSFPIWVRADNPRLRPRNAAVIFDSERPAESDQDLGSPNRACDPTGKGVGRGGAQQPYRNCLRLGRLLVVGEDLADEDRDGRIDEPNDYNDRSTISFDFAPLGTAVTIHRVDFLDIEDRSRISFLDAAGRAIGKPIEIELTDDNGLVRRTLGPTANVSKMVVRLGGSGAIDNIVFSRDSRPLE